MSVPGSCTGGETYPRKDLLIEPFDLTDLPSDRQYRVIGWDIDFGIEGEITVPAIDDIGVRFVIQRAGSVAVEGTTVQHSAEVPGIGLGRVPAGETKISGSADASACLVAYLPSDSPALETARLIPRIRGSLGDSQWIGGAVGLQILVLDDPNETVCYSRWPLAAAVIRDPAHARAPARRPAVGGLGNEIEAIGDWSLLRADWEVSFERLVDEAVVVVLLDCATPGGIEGSCGYRCFSKN